MTEFQLQANVSPDSSNHNEQRDQTYQAFAVLVDAVATLTREGARPPTASEARLAMKRLTYGGFNPKDLGYSRFRDFLADAETRGLVVVDTSRHGDVAVRLGPSESSVSSSGRVIRRDLWRAFVDWTATLVRFYDLKHGCAVVFPSEPAPLEPGKYREFRTRIASNPEEFVKIEPIPVHRQLSWMNEFAEKVDDPQHRAVLIAALSSEKPVKAFNTVLRSVPGQAVRWKVAFQGRAREHIESWRRAAGSDNLIEIYRDSGEVASGVGKPSSSESRETSAATSPSSVPMSFAFRVGAIPFTNFSQPSVPVPHPSDNVSELRARLHAAIDRMPLEELKALRMPVGYLFQE